MTGTYKVIRKVAGKRTEARHQHRRVVLTQRDIQIINWVAAARLATREHVQRLFFSRGSRSRAQQRLTLLYRLRYLCLSGVAEGNAGAVGLGGAPP